MMNLSCLLSLLKEMPAYTRLVRQLSGANHEHEAIILDAAKPYLIATLHEELNSPMVVITAQPENARRLHEQLQVWCPPSAELHYFLELDFLPYNSYQLSAISYQMLERLRALSTLALYEPLASPPGLLRHFVPRNDEREGCHSEGTKAGMNPATTIAMPLVGSGLVPDRASAHQGKLREESRDPSPSSFASAQDSGFRVTVKPPPLIVTSALAVITKTVSRGDFVAACHVLSQGMSAEPLNLLRKWQGMGYEMEDIVETPGTMSRRGGIVDVFPPCSQSPVRIEFFGNQIESMRLFDPESQRSTEPICSITITPPKEVAGDGSILDYLDDKALVILDAPEEIQATVQRLHNQAQELILRANSCQLPPNRGFPLPYFTWEELESKVRAKQRLALKSWDTTNGYEQTLPFSSPQSYGGRLENFLKAARQITGQEQRLLVVSHQANRLAELLQEEGIHISPTSSIEQAPPPGSITMLQGSLAEGWTMDNRLNLITDVELFGFVKQARPSKKMPLRRQWLLPQLTPGDYVVHVDHGIARFNGLTRMSTEGIEREYLILEYGGNDRLYVPTEQIERVSRYIGVGDQPPPLSRLGTQEWERTKKRVKQSVADVAQELLELYAVREVTPGFAFSHDTLWQQELEASFPYMETPDQLESIMAVKEDMERPKPMDRLICGDVGYGKTEVALRAAFKAVMDNKQVAILVPTTVLAQQHFTTFKERLQTFPLRVEMLSRFCSPEKERGILEGLATGTVDICIGTHRLLQKDVAFKDLGLVTIDEEQRFGVVQKEKFKQVRKELDTLALSATPIPRTLHMSLTGIRDMSIMETPPEERLSIKTYIGAYDEELLRRAILRELERNGQVFFVHNRVQSIALAASKLQVVVPEARIAIAHGQMPEEKLEKVMADFIAGNHDILVTTTIIQLGLDMPNVNTLIVDQADKFGLAQLYQLRGRVGRGVNQAYAYFLCDKGKELTPQAYKRLRTISQATELGAGFGIAMKDLEIRGAGNLLGVKQSGHIAAIGFNLYCQLLAEVVEELRVGQTRELREDVIAVSQRPEHGEGEAKQPPSITLPLTAHIPEGYLSNLDTRLSLYRRLAKAECLEEIEDIAQELKDRFGALPQPVKNLLYMVKIKVLAARTGVQSIFTQGRQVVLNLTQGRGVLNLASLHEYQDAIKVGTKQVRLDTKRLGNKWQEVLEKLLAG